MKTIPQIVAAMILTAAVILIVVGLAGFAREGDIEPNMTALNRIIDQINATDPNADLPGIDPDDNTNWSENVRALQGYLEVKPDAQFGPNSISAYQAWAGRNSVEPVRLQDVQRIRDIIWWIQISSRATDAQTASLGIWLAIMYYESYFDAMASPFGRMQTKSSTATGLLQITHTTAKDIVTRILPLIARNGEALQQEQDALAEFDWLPNQPGSIRNLLENPHLNIHLALTLFYYDSLNGSRDGALGRWEAWEKYNPSIRAKGEKIDRILSDWINAHPGQPLRQLDVATEQRILTNLRK